MSVAGSGVEGILISPVVVSFDSVSTSVEVEVEVLSSVVAATTRLLASVSSASEGIAVSDAVLPLEILLRLAAVSLSVTPDVVEIERGRSVTFTLTTSERLVQEAVGVRDSDVAGWSGFSFDVGSVKRSDWTRWFAR